MYWICCGATETAVAWNVPLLLRSATTRDLRIKPTQSTGRPLATIVRQSTHAGASRDCFASVKAWRRKPLVAFLEDFAEEERGS